MRRIIAELRTSVVAVLSLGILVCGVYPLVVWGLAQSIFPRQSNGSLIERNGKIVGSSLLGQNFAGEKYFHPRPSAAGDGYDAANSGGANLGPTSRKLSEAVAERVGKYRAENGLADNVPIPADAVTTSGSGLDPHIGVENALLQAARIAKARGLTVDKVKGYIAAQTEGRDLGVFGEPRVNVMALNLLLDGSR